MIKQPILVELQYFVDSVYKGIPAKDTAQLVRCSLNLLEDLPSAREAVFEYFSIVFNTAVKSYIIHIEKNIPEPPPEDESIQEIQEALEKLVTNGPPAWSPLISTWSLRLLGELSDKHSRRRTLDIRSACSLWLGSNAIRCLIGLTALCFSKLNDSETEVCISGLLTTFAQHSPHFDWVVARLGGCFPLKVISKILTCGLRRFTGEYDKLDSEVEILSYLSCSHESDLKFALKEMIETEMTNKLTIPYLLHLAKMSDTLAQSIVSVFLDLYSETRIQSMKVQAKFWPIAYNPNNLMHLLSGLVLKIKRNSVKVVLILAKVAEKYLWSQELLELVFVDLESLILDKKSCSFLEDIVRDSSKELLWQACISQNALEQQTAVRIILLASLQSPFFYHQSVAEILSSTSSINTTKPHLNALIRIIGGPYGTHELPKVKPGFEIALEKMILSTHKTKQNYNILKNIVDVIKLDKSNSSPHLRKTSCITVMQELITKILTIWEILLNRQKNAMEGIKFVNNIKEGVKKVKSTTQQEEETENVFDIQEQIHMIAKLIDIMEINGKTSPLNMSETLKLAHLTVQYFFFCLHQPGSLNHIESINRTYSLLSKQCNSRKSARSAALRDILEGALFSYGNLFGSQNESDFGDNDKPEELLIKLNQKQGVAMNAFRSTVLHAGIIGQGPKLPLKDAVGPDSNVQNKLMNAIVACCHDLDHQNTVDGFSFVSLMLVELVSTDVMYNGLPWPEEEFTRVTMERDLQIRRTFRNAPILWSMLGLIAAYRPALCYSSVLLRALCASVLHQWRAKSAESLNGNKTELMYVTTKLLELLSLGQLLPPPLDHLHIVVEYFEAHEIALVLKDCVWNYMKDHVPSPVLFVCDQTGLHWRDPQSSRPLHQYTDPLRNTMQKKISKLGHLYNQMFVVPDSNNLATPNQKSSEID